MKSKMLIAAILGCSILASCGSQRNFNSRKYTKGIFRIEKKSFKSDGADNLSEEETLDIEQSLVVEEPLILNKVLEEQNASTNDLNLGKERSLNKLERLENVEVEKNSKSVILVSSNEEQKPRSQISNQKGSKSKKAKEHLSIEKRQARFSLTWGIVAISLMTSLILLALFTMPYFYPYVLFYIGRSLKIALIPAMIGITNSILAKSSKKDLGKYESHRKIGFWLSLSTIILWALL